MGEDLVLYKDQAGRYGLVDRHCSPPPRRPLLRLRRGVRPALQLPRLAVGSAPAGASSSRSRRSRTPRRASRTAIRIKAYPVEAKAGLLWAYLGPAPAPLVPDWELFTEHGFKQIVFSEIPCNWFQGQENSIDPVHFEWLHSNWSRALQRRRRAAPADPPRGRLRRVRVRASSTAACSRTRPRTTSCGPSAACACGRTACSPASIRVARADRRRAHAERGLVHRSRARRDGAVRAGADPVLVRPDPGPDTGAGSPRHVMNQDFVAWVGQGAVADRTRSTSARATAASS